jgi:exodeoxyribonuclease VII large subunit
MQESPADVISVTELNRLARFALERALPIRWVSGEVSNLSRAPSGHWYFTLKDAHAAVRCAMFRNRNQFLDWLPENGMQVEVKAQATLYEARGDFQLSVEAMRRAGLGALFEAYARLKAKLEVEGLFDAGRKRALPALPSRIGIVTSAKAAALRDVLSTLRRRWPAASLVIYPTLVQGKGAAEQIASAIKLAGTRAESDLLLLVRGGGSIEDLWAFNEEAVARAIAACPIPVVTGVGHETDFTIADFVADLRAPTPTGAAQLATPDRRELLHRLAQSLRRLRLAQRRRLDSLAQRLDGLGKALQHPTSRLQARRQHLGHLQRRMQLAAGTRLAELARHASYLANRLAQAAPRPADRLLASEHLMRRLSVAWRVAQQKRLGQLQALQNELGHLNPGAILARGYSLVRREDGAIVRDARQLAPDSPLAIRFAQGSAMARVERIDPEE